MLTKLDLETVRENIQDDLMCILDGLGDAMLDNVCDVIVFHMEKLLKKVPENEP